MATNSMSANTHSCVGLNAHAGKPVRLATDKWGKLWRSDIGRRGVTQFKLLEVVVESIG
jgi:hypothetical protein